MEKSNSGGNFLKVEKQKEIYDGEILCPICECQAESLDWEQIDGYMRVQCACDECDTHFEIWYSLNYVEHREIDR
jgi:hypothetical protein